MDSDYLDERYLIANSDTFQYSRVLPVDPGVNLNETKPVIFTVPQNSQWELPCLSYLNVEGQLVKADGTLFTKDAAGNYPNITITNNFFPYLFSKMEYYINSSQIEYLEEPGQLTTINALIKDQRIFNGLELGWSLDTGAGQANVGGGVFMYYPVPLTTVVFTPLADITRINYLAWLKNTFRDYFTDYNPGDFEIHDGDGIVVAAPEGPTRAELLANINIVRTAALNGRLRLNIAEVATGDFPAGAVDVAMIIACGNALLRKFNQSLASRYTIVPDPNMNTGFEDRKNLLFNKKGNIMADGDAGRFKMRIPLEHLFNFCAMYRKGIFNARHELRLNRQIDDYAIFRHTGAGTDGKIRLDKIEWMIPRLVLNTDAKLAVNPSIVSGATIPMNFMNKQLLRRPLDRGVTRTSITYNLPGINTLKYIVLAFQSRDLTVYPTVQLFNNSLFNDPYNRRDNIIDVALVKVKLNSNSYYISDLSNNSCDRNFASAYYNEFKKMRQDYLGDYRDTDMVSYVDFINLYRLYCINLSSQPKVAVGSSGFIDIELEFTRPVPLSNIADTNVFIVNYFDSEWLLKTDGTGQYAMQKPKS